MKLTQLLVLVLLCTNIYAGTPGNISIPGKIYFSKQPFGNSNTGSAASFSSNDYIYARLELDAGTIKEAFKIKETDKTEPYPYLKYECSIFRNGEQVGNTYKNNYLLLKPEDLQRNWINFDVLPDPLKPNSLFSFVPDFRTGIGFFPLYQIIDESHFPDEGKYSVHVKFTYQPVNAWGKMEDDPEKWPSLEGAFDFNFRNADINTLEKNRLKAIDVARENAFRYDKLPAVFSNPAVITDAKATNVKIAAILKRDLPKRSIIKFAVEKTTGVLWHIAKDDIGIPKYRYFNPDIYVAYKMDGKCYVGTVTLREVYQGGGSYGPLQVAFTSQSDGPDKGIDCEKIK